MYIDGLYIRESGNTREIVENGTVVLRCKMIVVANLLEITSVHLIGRVDVIRTLVTYVESTFSNLTHDERLLKLIRPVISIESNALFGQVLQELHYTPQPGLFTSGTFMRREYFTAQPSPKPPQVNTPQVKTLDDQPSNSRNVHVHIHT